MRKRTKFVTLLAVVIMCMAAALGVVGCKDGKGLTISQTEVSVPLNGTVNLTATFDGDTVAAEWSIDKTDIATLTVIGNLCIVKPTAEGTATITASYEGKTATCALTVTPDNTETVVIKDGDTEITEVSVAMGGNKQLTAVASKGSAVTWSSSNEYVATVDGNGLITGVLGGTCTVTAQVTASIKAEVTVTVIPPEGSDFYNLKFAEEDGSKIASVDYSEAAERGKFFYWGGKWIEFNFQEVTVQKAYFQNNEVHIKYICDTDDGRFNGFQVFYKHPDHTLKHYYKLTCTIDIDTECDVTLNGEVFNLTEGENDLEVYYQYTSGMIGDAETEKYGMSSFDLIMGVDDGSNNDKGQFVQNAEFTVKNMTWVEDTARVQLEAPAATYDAETKVITITDPNAEGVGSYLLKLYNENDVAVSTIPVVSGEEVDLSYTDDGTYTGKVIAKAKNPHYIDSAESVAIDTPIEVENPFGPSYELEDNNKIPCTTIPGRWTYWSEWWVGWNTRKFEMGKLIADFSNNAGTWHATQLFYKNPADETDKIYKMTLTIDAPKDGRVTVNGDVVTLKQGEHSYDIYYKATNGASIQILFGVSGETDGQEIQSGPVTIVIDSIVEHTPVALKKPTATVADGKDDDAGKKIITIVDEENDANTCTYEVGFFSGEASALVLEDKVTVESGKAIDISSLLAGTYSMKIRALSTSLGFEDSDWSNVIGTITSTSTTLKIKNGTENDAYTAKKLWVEWHDHTNWNQSEVVVTEATHDTETGVVKLTYEITSGTNLYNNPMQLFWHDPEMKVGQGYKLTLKINASLACVININEQNVTLVKGDNDVVLTFEHIADRASLRIVFPDSGEGSIKGGTFEFSNIAIAEITDADKTKLAAPTFTLDGDNKITVADTNTEGVGRYELGFFVDNAETPSKTVIVESGKVVDVSRVENGTYTVKLKAVAASLLFIDSDWAGSASLTVENEGGPAYDLDTNVTARPDEGVWGLWHDGGVTITKAEYKNNSVVITFSSTTNLVYGLQIKYVQPNYVDGQYYSFDVTATTAMNIQAISGESPVCSLTANETKQIIGNTSDYFYMQVNVTNGLSGTITISNVKWEELTVTTLTAPTFTLNDKVIDITDLNAAGVGKYVLGFFAEGATDPAATLDVTDGMTLDVSSIANGTYTLKLMAKAANATYADSAWSTTTANMTIENDRTVINYNGESELTAGWSYWNGGPTVSECYIDADGAVHLTYTGKGGWYGMQLFYKETATTGKAHSLTLNINASVAGDITVNGQVVTLSAGDNAVSVENYGGSSISIQFGKNGGAMIDGGTDGVTFVLSNIVLTAAA